MKKFFKIFRYIIVAVFSVVFVTIGIDAADNFDNMSSSIVGKIFFKDEGPCSADMTFIPSENGGFCIDKYEVTPGESCPYIEIESQIETRDNLNFNECKPVSVKGVTPWVFISQTQAMNACAKAGKRLPSEEEWYLASLGTPDPESGWMGQDCHVDSNWDTQPGLSGSGKNCQSSYGAYDMVGNVLEWVKDEIVDGKYNGEEMPDAGYISLVSSDGVIQETSGKADPNFNSDYFWIKKSAQRGMARGGYWENKEEAGIYATYLVSPSSYAGSGVGFRCVK